MEKAIQLLSSGGRFFLPSLFLSQLFVIKRIHKESGKLDLLNIFFRTIF